MVEYREIRKDKIGNLEKDKIRLMVKMKKLQDAKRLNDIRLERNTRKRDINTFYQYLLMDYENRELKRDRENDTLKKLLLSLDLKFREVILNGYFHSIDLEDLLLEEYKLGEQYKDLCGMDSWCGERISSIEGRVEAGQLIEGNFTKRK